MAAVVLDTSVVVALLSPTDALHEPALAAVEEWDEEDAAFLLSTVAWAELVTGVIRRGAQARSALDAFRARVVTEIVPVDIEVAEVAARIRATDLALRMPDAIILATGVRRSASVVTADRRLAKAAPERVDLIEVVGG